MQAKHYGTLGLVDQHQLSSAYDRVTEHLPMEPRFYRWVARQLDRAGYGPETPTRVLDIGCGTGVLLSVLTAAGYQQLSGIDFSAECVSETQAAVPRARVWQHDLLSGPVPAHDAIVMTEVIEHVADPLAALGNVRESLAPGGRLLLTFPNRWAYWPGSSLTSARAIVPRRWAWGRFAVDWLTTPYEMRSSQPIDHAYSVPEVRAFLQRAGFRIVNEDGVVLWPMLRVERFPWTFPVFDFLEDTLGQLWPRAACYRYMFTCARAW